MLFSRTYAAASLPRTTVTVRASQPENALYPMLVTLSGSVSVVRPRHLEGMKALGKQIICAGGLLDEEGRMKGSALVMEFEDRAALDAYLAAEPYVTEGVWEKIEVEPMNVVLVLGEKAGK